MSDKLPEWPKMPEMPCSLGAAIRHYQQDRDAALARMEALAKELSAMAAIFMPRRDEARQRIDELLAACEREKG